MLCSPFSQDEIKEAVWGCGNDKSPGPDGFNFRFIKNLWDLLKHDVESKVKEFFDRGTWPKGCNASFISLISKGENPQGLTDYRSISLIGSLYKIISKLLANRLRGVIGKVIDESQSAFVGERNMLDSVVVANEIIHEAKCKKKPTLVMKVDFEKAYDSIDWDFLVYMMRRMRFCEKWVGWIVQCLQSTTISVLVNGSATDQFVPERGIRQGDPMAPFLFLIVAEGLNGLVRMAVQKKKLTGYRMAGDTDLEVPILQFADDTLFFCEATMQNVVVIKSILRCFELASGLKVNFHKSSLGGIAVDNTSFDQFLAFLNCKSMRFPFTYLGIPIGGNPHSIRHWDPIVAKVRRRLTSWGRRSLSFGGR